MPLITVILPVYNIKGEYLTKAVGSVLAQSFDDFELLIVDDGSRRETAAVCDELAAEDKRITVFHNVNQGPGKSRNFGLSKAQGAFGATAWSTSVAAAPPPISAIGGFEPSIIISTLEI